MGEKEGGGWVGVWVGGLRGRGWVGNMVLTLWQLYIWQTDNKLGISWHYPPTGRQFGIGYDVVYMKLWRYGKHESNWHLFSFSTPTHDKTNWHICCPFPPPHMSSACFVNVPPSVIGPGPSPQIIPNYFKTEWRRSPCVLICSMPYMIIGSLASHTLTTGMYVKTRIMRILFSF